MLIKSIYTAKVIIEKSRGGRFLGKGIEIWAGFGPFGNFLDQFFSCFHEQKKIKNMVDIENIFGIE